MRFLRYSAVFLFSSWSSIGAFAADARIAVPSYALQDPFVQTLRNTTILTDVGTKVQFISHDVAMETLESVLKGSTDLALVTLDNVTQYKFKTPPELVPIFTRPFLFSAAQDAFSVQAAPLGNAVLADLNRTGLVALGFWNRGTSQLIAQNPVKTLADFRGLKVVASQDKTATAAVFTKYGASVTQLPANQISNAITAGAANAAIVDKVPEGFFNLSGAKYTSTLRPLVGVLVANRKYWSDLSESERRAWHYAADAAGDAARTALVKQGFVAEKYGKALQINLDKDQKFALLQGSETDLPRLLEQINLVEQSLAEIRNQDVKKKSEIQSPSIQAAASILFATDRDDENTSDIETRFGIKRSQNWGPSCGLIKFGQFSSNGLEGSHDARTPLNAPKIAFGISDCARFVAEQLRSRNNNRVLLFIHGYSNTFKDAIARGIFLSQATNYPGIILVWSWPSDGWAPSYGFDVEAASWSANHLAPLISALVKAVPDVKFDVLAHSLGNRLLLYILEFGHVPASHFDSIAFAAPDVASDIFVQSVANIGLAAPLQTLYASNSDAALFASSIINSPYEGRIRRAGYGGSDILIMKGIESVDATNARTGIINHSYIFDDPKVTSDLTQIVDDQKHAKDRGLEIRHRGTEQYWEIRQ